jgi:hypothetical protein
VEIEYPGFGVIVIAGERFEHDIVIEHGQARRRHKGPSKAGRGEYGHTPLTAAEDIPWSSPKLVVGTGHSGRLPITADVRDEATKRSVELITLPTAAACRLLRSMADDDVAAILHITC